MPITFDRKAFRFFLHNAGYATPPGRVPCAAQLATAERKASDLDITFEWVGDELGDLGDHDYWCRKNCGISYHEVDGCIMRDSKGEEIGALWGIIDADDNYRRVVQAELASEVVN